MRCSVGLNVFLFLAGSFLLNADAGAESVILFDSRQGREFQVEKIQKSEEEWKKQLTSEQYHVTREKGTERAFTGHYHAKKEKGMYQCVCCGTDLFSSETKFDSGTGWPSFWAPVSEKNISQENDHIFLVKRVEVLCSRCNAHLGHVFEDGPPPTGKRYCINSAALQFKKQ